MPEAPIKVEETIKVESNNLEDQENIAMGISIESASYIENSNNLVGENADTEENSPKLFSEDSNETVNEENSAIDNSNYDQNEKLFDQDTKEEEDFEIPAFLRKQKF